MARLHSTDFGQVDSVWILYWQDSTNARNSNTFFDDLLRLERIYEIDSLIRQKGFDYAKANTNRKTREWEEHKHWVERHRGQKEKGNLLVIINQGKQYESIRGSSGFKLLEQLLEDLYKSAYGKK